jgi:glycosyltransferase involved in cell wall biosynthesis
MKVLMLQDTKNYAGTEAHVLTLSAALSDLGSINAELLVPRGSELEQRGRTIGIRCHVCNQNTLAFFCKTFLVVMKTRPEIVHAHNGRSALISVLVSKILGFKVVATQHFLEPAHVSSTGILGKVKRVIHQWVGRQVDHRICVSNAAFVNMQRRGDTIAKRAESYTVIHNGIDVKNVLSGVTKMRDDVRTEFRIPVSSKLVTCAARLEAEKNIDVLIDAFKIIVDAGTDATLVIMGEGSQRMDLQQHVNGLRLTESVTLAGFRTDVHSVIAASDAFVLPAANEPFGLVLLEAMSLGVRTIAASSGGPLEIIDDGITGYLFRPDDVEHLSKQLLHALNEHIQGATALGATQQVITDNFSSSAMAHATSRTYFSVIGEGQ